MTWLDIGNGWRNLFLLSTLLQMGALGLLLAAHRLPSRKSRLACFFTGVAATPLCQYLWMLVMALLWPHAPRLVLIGAPPALAAVTLLVMVLRRIRRIKPLCLRAWAFAKKLCRFDKAALVALCFALCVVILIGPATVRFLSSMQSVTHGGDSGEYMALAQRYCEDRDLGKLLEKEETVGHFRGHSHFPSLELYMSYGLLHTSGQVGYPNDKAAFTALGLLTFCMAAAYLALLFTFCREKRMWVLLGVILLNLVPDLYDSVAGAPRDIWRILALLLAALVFSGVSPAGDWKRYVGKLALSFAVCFTVMSTHVVCFVVLPFIVVAWVIWRFVQARMTCLHGEGKTLLRSVGIALAGAAGTLVAFAGNLWCFIKWGEMSPWRLMNTFTDAPWYPLYMDMEYKLEETTTHLNFLEAKDSILRSYSTAIGDWGLYLSLAALAGVMIYAVCSRIRMRRTAKAALETARQGGCANGPVAVLVTNRSAMTEPISLLMLIALYTLLTLAPMTGVLDSPLYSFSGSFLKLPRYTLQWFLMANVMTCATLALLGDLWPKVCDRVRPLGHTKCLPALLCVLLCVLGFVKGTNQTGYTNTFYRYSRSVMENEAILLDNGYRERYALLSEVAAQVPQEKKILITRAGYQYALRARGYVLSANPIVPLMNLPLSQVGPALDEMNVAMVASEPKFWDERYFGQSTLSEYLNALPLDQIVETETMRLYLLDRSLIPAAQAALAQAEE